MTNVTLVQPASPTGETTRSRVGRVLDVVDDCATASDLVMLPELWATGYFAFDRYADDAQALDGELVVSLRAIARDRQCHIFGGSFVEQSDAGLHNTALLIDPNGEVALVYRKVHLFGLGSRETELLVPGERLAVGQTSLGVVALTTCYDLRFPELYRALMERSTEIVLVAAAWPAARRSHWELLTRTRAVENQYFVLACNGVGGDEVELAGHSMVVDPSGEVVMELDEGPACGRVKIELAEVDAARKRFPVLADRRLPLANDADG